MQTLKMLKKTDDFSSVFSFKKRFSSIYFVVHYKPNELSHPQVGFIVAKKTAKLSVDRNYMRRVLRELCRHELSISLHADVIIQVKKNFNNKEFATVKNELNSIFDKIKHKLTV